MWLTQLIVFILSVGPSKGDPPEGGGTLLAVCHDEPTYAPDEGVIATLQFPWLALLQYIHVKNGNPHHFRAPRVALVSPRHALCTARDASDVPSGYALGNVVFPEYERDERECGLTSEQLAAGAPCTAAVLAMPVRDVFVRSQGNDGVALLVLMSDLVSKYMVPVCLPLLDHLSKEAAEYQEDEGTFYHVDYPSAVPRDYMNEDKEMEQTLLLPQESCHSPQRGPQVNQSLGDAVCFEGCGFHSGAPTLVHEHTGHWTLVALVTDEAACEDPLSPSARLARGSRHTPLLRHADWLRERILGERPEMRSQDDPFGYGRPVNKVDMLNFGWVGHWWLGGVGCFERGEPANRMFRFYHETFSVEPRKKINMTYYLQVQCPTFITVVCVKVGLPYQIGRPRVWGILSDYFYLRIPLIKLQAKYEFHVEAWGMYPVPGVYKK